MATDFKSNCFFFCLSTFSEKMIKYLPCFSAITQGCMGGFYTDLIIGNIQEKAKFLNDTELLLLTAFYAAKTGEY